MESTLADVLAEHARSWPAQLAVVDGATRLTYSELEERCARLAGALQSAGAGRGQRVVWLGQNSFRVLELVLAAARLGALLCPVNWRYSAEEMSFVLADLQPAVVFWQEEEIGETVAEARRSFEGPARWIQHEHEYEAFAGSAYGSAAADTGAGDAVLLIYTAAWSGRPGAAMLSHRALISQGLVLGNLAGVGPESVYLNSGPLFHLGTLMNTFSTFVAAGCNVFTRRVDAEELCRIIEGERCTGAFIVGPTIGQMVAVLERHPYDLSSLRWPGGPGDSSWHNAVSTDTSPWGRLPGGYGQTETTGMLTYTALAPGGIGSHGRAAPIVQVRITGPDGREVATGEVGEIVARGATVMNGYWNRPEANLARRRDGWHRTNDLGRREADGTLSFVGPLTRMIKSAAENIYPAEVEQALASHPGIAECAVIGVPDPRWVQSVRAIVVLRPGWVATETELIEHCRSRLASYKKPRSVEFTDALPRVGFAVDYDRLDATYGGGNYPGGGTRSA